MGTFLWKLFNCTDCFAIGLALNYATKTCLQQWKHSTQLQEIIWYFLKFVILGTFLLFSVLSHSACRSKPYDMIMHIQSQCFSDPHKSFYMFIPLKHFIACSFIKTDKTLLISVPYINHDGKRMLFFTLPFSLCTFLYAWTRSLQKSSNKLYITKTGVNLMIHTENIYFLDDFKLPFCKPYNDFNHKNCLLYTLTETVP